MYVPLASSARLPAFAGLGLVLSLLIVLVIHHLAATDAQAVSHSPKSRHRHSSSMSSPSAAADVVLEGRRKQVLEDVLDVSCTLLLSIISDVPINPQLFSSKPSLEIFQRSWREDAIFEVSPCSSGSITERY